ncbi:hypothetical protein ACTFIZ_005633 [Dictyostelium cf. discoideum]
MSYTNTKEETQIINKENNDIKKRKFIENNNNNNTNNNKNNNNKNNNNKSNNKKQNNNNKKPRLKFTYDYNYKIISPFQKFLDYGICPTLNELYSEFYHILNENKCQKLKMELDELKKMNKGDKPIPIDFDPSKICHQHSKEDIEQIIFHPNDRYLIELAVRKFCGFLQKESNMVLMEMIILSIGLLKSIEFLHFTLEIERDGGIFTTVIPKSNNNTTTTTTTTTTTIINDDNTLITTDDSNEQTSTVTAVTAVTSNTNCSNSKSSSQLQPITRRRTPGGVFYKLINLHIPTEFKSNLFSISSLFKYKNERKKKGFGTLLDLKDKLLDFTSNNSGGNDDNNENSQEQINSKKFNKLLNEVDEEFDKLCVSSKNEIMT